ncbi:hypothetical protein T11_8706 [Trichinella zimbabwensis]|uniref:Uncharacterized protein n=1 Tax=Trichinella zimbabwensis TaxID=268475 RepID=A0A0V1GDA1_9BILA|nr:hypothetical protein T11_8706 [Trichinella zimbabwensis]
MEGELVGRKRHVAGKCGQSCLGKVAPGCTKFRWCGFCGMEKAQSRKKACYVVLVKSAVG